jgi:hypothetical protein
MAFPCAAATQYADMIYSRCINGTIHPRVGNSGLLSFISHFFRCRLSNASAGSFRSRAEYCSNIVFRGKQGELRNIVVDSEGSKGS